jgi:hypothetical protein
MKKLIVTLAVLFLALARAGVVLADQVCTTTYGGGVVCGAQAPEHEPVETGLGDINPLILGIGLIGASTALFVFSRKLKTRAI